MRAAYGDHLGAFEVGNLLPGLACYVYLSGCQCSQKLHSGLHCLALLVGKLSGAFGQRSGVEAGDENITYLDVGIGDDGIGPLERHGPEPGFEQEGLGLYSVGEDTVHRVFHGLLAGYFNLHTQNLAALSAHHGLYLPLCGRHYFQHLAAFGMEKRLPGEHFIAFAYLHFGDEPDEIVGHDGNSCHGSYFALARIGHRSLQMQVEAFFYFNPDIHYIICEC